MNKVDHDVLIDNMVEFKPDDQATADAAILFVSVSDATLAEKAATNSLEMILWRYLKT